MNPHLTFNPLREDRGAARQDDAGRSPPAAAQPVDSGTLFKGHRMLRIIHNGGVYVLRATNAGNLKLTK